VRTVWQGDGVRGDLLVVIAMSFEFVSLKFVSKYKTLDCKNIRIFFSNLFTEKDV